MPLKQLRFRQSALRCLLAATICWGAINPVAWAAADRSALLGQLQHRDFAQLIVTLNRLQLAYEIDPNQERVLSNALAAFANSDPELEPLLNAWQAAYPQSEWPLTARGIYFWQRARLIDAPASTSRQQGRADRSKRRTILRQAENDLSAALEKNDHLSIPFALLLDIAVQSHQTQKIPRLVNTALRSNAYSYRIHETYLLSQMPDTGGSIERISYVLASHEQRFNHFQILQPLRGFLYFALARAAAADQRPGVALKYFAKALSYGDTTLYRLARGNHYLHNQKPRKALQDFSRALQSDQDNPELLQSRARAYMALGETNAAMADISRALSFDTFNPRYRSLRAQLFSDQELFEKAIEDYEVAQAFGSNRPEIWLNLGWINLFRLKNFPSAEKYLKKAVMLNPNDAASWFFYGGALFSRDKHQQATQALQQYIILCDRPTRSEVCINKYRDWVINYMQQDG